METATECAAKWKTCAVRKPTALDKGETLPPPPAGFLNHLVALLCALSFALKMHANLVHYI